MSKRVFALALACLIFMLVGCNNNANTSGGDNSAGENNNAGNNNDEVYEERNADGDVVYRGEVKSVDNKKFIQVYIHNPITDDLYNVLISDVTVFKDKNGNSINRDQIKVGDTVEIGFSGQVMLSYPPQIVAKSITVN